MNSITLGLDSLGMIEMKVGVFLERVLAGHPMHSIDPLSLTTVNYKLSDLRYFREGLLTIIT